MGRGFNVQFNGAKITAPHRSAEVGRSVLAKFRYHDRVTFRTIAVLYGDCQNDDQARRIARFLQATGFCKIQQQVFGPSMEVVLDPQWESWEDAYRSWCEAWGFEVVGVAS